MTVATLPPLVELLVSALLVVGASFVLIGAIGVVRLPDIYSRLHAPGLGTTLGLGATLAASVLYFAGRGVVSLHELLIAFFIFITAPISAHLIAKSALHSRIRGTSGSGSEREEVE
ncbi:MAG: Na+/H+ antiporter subunit G [Gemmatimonadaceae bacterium]